MYLTAASADNAKSKLPIRKLEQSSGEIRRGGPAGRICDLACTQRGRNFGAAAEARKWPISREMRAKFILRSLACWPNNSLRVRSDCAKSSLDWQKKRKILRENRPLVWGLWPKTVKTRFCAPHDLIRVAAGRRVKREASQVPIPRTARDCPPSSHRPVRAAEPRESAAADSQAEPGNKKRNANCWPTDFLDSRYRC